MLNILLAFVGLNNSADNSKLAWSARRVAEWQIFSLATIDGRANSIGIQCTKVHRKRPVPDKGAFFCVRRVKNSKYTRVYWRQARVRIDSKSQGPLLCCLVLTTCATLYSIVSVVCNCYWRQISIPNRASDLKQNARENKRQSIQIIESDQDTARREPTTTLTNYQVAWARTQSRSSKHRSLALRSRFSLQNW